MKNVIMQFKYIFFSIPRLIRIFLIRVIICFTIWKFVYHLFLLPIRFPDKPLTIITTNISASIYKKFYPNNSISVVQMKDYKFYEEGIDHARIFKDGILIIGATDGCNELELFVLFIGFLICIPFVKFARVIKYAIIGLSIIFVLNISRVVALGFLHLYYNQYFDIAHHYVFKLIIYSIVFLIWMKFVKKSNLSYEKTT